MKKLLCFLLCLTLIFSSVSLSFATDISWNTTDSGHLTEIRNSLMSGGTIYNLINSCNTQLNNINYNLVTLMGWLDPSTGGSTTALLNQILSMLSYTDAAQGLKSWLADIWQTNASYLPLLNKLNNNGWGNSTATQAIYTMGWDGIVSTYSYTPSDNWQQNLMFMYQFMNNNLTQAFAGTNNQLHSDKWGIASLLSPETLQESRPTYNSTDHMLELYLQNIGVSSSRLAYVLASDERIEAQEAAAANEEAVVDNFIDSTGDGAASPSDIGSVSDLSSGYKQNFGSDASPSGIFDIFNADHATWFSQETKNQLDTTTPTRLIKGSESETPLLDKQIEDIYNALGVKQP